jgi:hypothetical protein
MKVILTYLPLGDQGASEVNQKSETSIRYLPTKIGKHD